MSFESFDDAEVIELPSDEGKHSQEEIEKDPSKDTFDNGAYQEVDKDSQTKLLDDQEDKGEKKGEKAKADSEKDKEEEKKDDDDKGDKDKEKEERIENKEDSQKGKTVKLKDGDKNIEASLDATIKMKVNGKNEFVSIKELRDNFAGKQAWSDKIETANTKLKEADHKINKYQEEKQEVVGHLTKIAGLLDKEDGDPLEALYYLLDMTGRDVNNYSKRIFDFMEEQVQNMSSMDDVEKELYWAKKKLDAINNNQAAKSEQLKREQTHRELFAKVDKMRESHGVSEEQYVQAHNELLNLGVKKENLTPERIVEYSAVKPYVIKAEELVSQFEDDLSDDDMDALISETAATMRKYPKISSEDALSFAAKGLGFGIETIDDDIDLLNKKVGNGSQSNQSKNMKYKSKEDPGHIESFDDFEF